MDNKDLKEFAEAQIVVCGEGLEKMAEFPKEEREKLTEYFTNHIALCEFAIKQLGREGAE